MEPNTIYALSSGSPPAAIAVIRISGPGADAAARTLTGRLPEERRAGTAILRDPDSGEVLDKALLLRFVAPATATGQDVIELHLHGGRAVVAGVLAALSRIPGLRPAEPGEFTRRAYENGRIDLAEAEGLADLLTAETQSQRRAALQLAGGALSKSVEGWQQQVLLLSAQLEASLDFSDEGDVVADVSLRSASLLSDLIDELQRVLVAPSVERLRDGIRVVIAGPPNAGKSTLLNRLIGREAAITSAIAGTTRDLVEAPAAIGGIPFLIVDTAGLRESGDEIEAIGIDRAKQSIATADIVLWLDEVDSCPDPDRSIIISAKADLDRVNRSTGGSISLSAMTGEGMDNLIALLTDRAQTLLPSEGELAINERHRKILADCLGHLREAAAASDPILASEALRQVRSSLDRITGRAGVEDMLGALFGRFCIGK